MKLYSRRGDTGKTSLLGGTRVDKDDPRVELCGTLDELNSLIGVVASYTRDDSLLELMEQIQRQLFVLASEIAAENEEVRTRLPAHIEKEDILMVENEIDRMETQLPKLKSFILPGGSKAASFCHLARTVCRRAERRLASWQSTDGNQQRKSWAAYLNRLSDLLFVLARFLNQLDGKEDICWQQRR